MLISGWSPESVSAHFASLGTEVPATTCAALRAALPPEAFLPANLLSEHFGGRAVRVNAVDELHRVLALQRERLGAALLLEEIDGAPAGSTTNLAAAYFEMLERTIKLQQSLGQQPNPTAKLQQANSAALPAGNQVQPTIAVLFQQVFAARGPASASPAAPAGVVVEGESHELDDD
jgi:hypothetical protein